LSPAELDYAAADVTYLADIYPALLAELEAQGRLAWLQEDAARATELSQYQPQPATAWQRLRGLARLSPPAQQIAAKIAAWREAEAVAKNRPRGWIVDDEVVYRIAEAAPASAAALAQMNVLPPKTLERCGDALLAAVAEGRVATPSVLAQDERLSSEQKAKLNRLREVVQAASTRLGVPAGLLAPRAELDALMQSAADASVRVLAGWRRRELGEALLGAL
jgi:ribonuclease D